MENNKNGVEVTPVKQFKFAIRFQDGERDGKPQDFVYGFNVVADDEITAKATMLRHLEACVEELKK
jgi:hypothetical protein